MGLAMINGAVGAGPSQLVKDDRILAFPRKTEERKKEHRRGAAHVSSSVEARHLRTVGAPIRHGKELRATKINKLKIQIVQGTYHVTEVDVAKSIIRSGSAWLLKTQ